MNSTNRRAKKHRETIIFGTVFSTVTIPFHELISCRIYNKSSEGELVLENIKH
jgi:hypothetical protein